MRHTAGQWRSNASWEKDRVNPMINAVDDRGCLKRVALVFSDRQAVDENARLIAAAPDLLGACEKVLEIARKWQVGEIPDDALMAERFRQAVNMAIAKAKGERQ